MNLSLANNKKYNLLFIIFLVVLFVIPNLLVSQQLTQENKSQLKEFMQYEGTVLDAQTKKPLVFVALTLVDSNISTITNAEGAFTLKVPANLIDRKLEITMLGYSKKRIPLLDLQFKKNKIYLKTAVIKLSEVILNLPLNAKQLVTDVFKSTKKNYAEEHVLMTAFYRETIKKKRKNVSLAEAIVTIYKQPYISSFKDKIKLYKARKSTDYSKLDTIALKLEGGPFNALFVDMIKYPEYIFTSESLDYYTYSYLPTTTIKDRAVYVVSFTQKKELQRPLFYGKLYIDVKSKALVSAIYSLNVKDKKKSAQIFVKKKPKDVFVYPTSVSYRIDYREKNGKWYYGYSNAQLTFKIKRKRKWFKTSYSINSEMLVTDWKANITKEKPNYKERMRHSIIISDEASGFSDPEFWGEYNVIEPDKSIESAIKKIKKKLIL